MSAMDVTGVLVFGFAAVWASIELGWSIADEAMRRRNDAERDQERPSSLPRPRW